MVSSSGDDPRRARGSRIDVYGFAAAPVPGEKIVAPARTPARTRRGFTSGFATAGCDGLDCCAFMTGRKHKVDVMASPLAEPRCLSLVATPPRARGRAD